jgi:hypothetical protein
MRYTAISMLSVVAADQRCDAVGCRQRCRLLSLMLATFTDVGYFSQ